MHLISVSESGTIRVCDLEARLSEIKLENGSVVESTAFFKYDLASMKETDLNRVAQKCVFLIRTKNGNEFDAAKAMLGQITDEKNFRVSKAANEISLRNFESANLNNKQAGQWSKIAVLAVIVVGVMQACATLVSSSQFASAKSEISKVHSDK